MNIPKFLFCGCHNYLGRCLFIVTLLLLIYPCISAETPKTFKHYSTPDGLCESSAEIILQDHQGYMWFGTSTGLSRFDGNKFVTYKKNEDDSTSLSGNWISAI